MELVSGGTAEKDFYSHAREGRDRQLRRLQNALANFYSHAREGRDFVSAGATWKCTNFYSHAREGRDDDVFRHEAIINISTHTPARGVTNNGKSSDRRFFISTHTPARGVT